MKIIIEGLDEKEIKIIKEIIGKYKKINIKIKDNNSQINLKDIICYEGE